MTCCSVYLSTNHETWWRDIQCDLSNLYSSNILDPGQYDTTKCTMNENIFREYIAVKKTCNFVNSAYKFGLHNKGYPVL